MESSEKKIFQDFYHELLKGIVNPLNVAGAMFSAKLIDEITLQKITDYQLTQDRNNCLLRNLEPTIKNNPSSLLKFIEILKNEEESTCGVLASQMETQLKG